jgi:hypothetical protein
MPKQYEAIRDKLIAEGKSTKEAKKHAAMIYNSKHKKNPVTRTSDKSKQKKHMKDVLQSSRKGLD